MRGIGEAPILSPFAEPNRAQASQRTIRALQDGIAKISEVLKDPKANLSADKINEALAEQARLVEDLNKAYNDLEVNLFLDSIESLKGEVRDINTEAGFGLSTPLQAAQREFSAAITRIQEYQEKVRKGVDMNKKSATSFANSAERAKQLAIEIQELIRAEQITQALFSTIMDLGNAFAEAKQSGEDFGQALGENLKKILVDLAVRVGALIVMFGILSVIASGTGSFAKLAQSLIGGGDLGSFIGANLIGGGGLRPGQGLVTSGAGAPAPRVSVEGVISGNNLVLMNDRGTRSFDRTFG